MKKKELLGYGILVIVCVIGIVALILRAEQLDTKKELSQTVNKEVIVQSINL